MACPMWPGHRCQLEEARTGKVPCTGGPQVRPHNGDGCYFWERSGECIGVLEPYASLHGKRHPGSPFWSLYADLFRKCMSREIEAKLWTPLFHVQGSKWMQLMQPDVMLQVWRCETHLAILYIPRIV